MLFTRREMLRKTALSALALGIPRILRANERGADFRFIVVNDLHYRDARCGEWFEGVVRAMRSHEADFCVLNGDLAENGHAEQIGAVREIFGQLRVPLFATIGNHDHAAEDDRRAFEQIFPRSINYHFEHKGWQFVALDSTQGQQVFYTKIPQTTLDWLDENLPSINHEKPTVLLTHFPMGTGVWTRPRNAPQVLERFRRQSLRAVFNGHWHGYTRREFAHAPVTTNRCCSWWRANNDATPQKGYFLCSARDGEITRTFCEIKRIG